MEKKQTILLLAVYGLGAGAWFSGVVQMGVLGLILGIAFSVKFFLELWKCWRNWKKKS